MPWTVAYEASRRRLSLIDADRRTFADRVFGATVAAADPDEIISTLRAGGEALNTLSATGTL